MIFVTTPFEAEIPRFSYQNQKNSKKYKIEFKIVDSHWEQLALDLSYQFWYDTVVR